MYQIDPRSGETHTDDRRFVGSAKHFDSESVVWNQWVAKHEDGFLADSHLINEASYDFASSVTVSWFKNV